MIIKVLLWELIVVFNICWFVYIPVSDGGERNDVHLFERFESLAIYNNSIFAL